MAKVVKCIERMYPLLESTSRNRVEQLAAILPQVLGSPAARVAAANAAGDTSSLLGQLVQGRSSTCGGRPGSSQDGVLASAPPFVAAVVPVSPPSLAASQPGVNLVGIPTQPPQQPPQLLPQHLQMVPYVGPLGVARFRDLPLADAVGAEDAPDWGQLCADKAAQMGRKLLKWFLRVYLWLLPLLSLVILWAPKLIVLALVALIRMIVKLVSQSSTAVIDELTVVIEDALELKQPLPSFNSTSGQGEPSSLPRWCTLGIIGIIWALRRKP